jgi:hypothetical protein
LSRCTKRKNHLTSAEYRAARPHVIQRRYTDGISLC